MVTEASPPASGQLPQQLLSLLQALRPEADLSDRLDALEDLARLHFDIGALRKPAPLQVARLRTLLTTLTAAPEFRDRLRATVASVLRDTTAVALFSEAGIPNDRGLASETVDRISRRVLPRPPDDEDLERFVSRVFRTERNCAWIEVVPIEILVELGEVLGDIWRPVREAMSDAIALLTTRISALGLSVNLRERSDPMQVRDSPFFRIPHVPLEEIPTLILECRGQLSRIHARLETTGVSTDVVYCIDTIRRMLLRIERMLPFLTNTGAATDPVERAAAARTLIGALTAGRIADESLRSLGRQSLGLLAKRIIERVGHSGEQYVTSDRRQYWKMFVSAAGGGALAAFTVIGTFWAQWASFVPFIDGFLAAGDYAGSFLAMQFLGLTLATKQPSMTAAAIAKTIKDSAGKDRGHQLDDLVTLIARITRSQFVATLANIMTVVPVVIGIDLLWLTASGRHVLDPAQAQLAIDELHPYRSGTIFFAAMTGVLLWLSSLGAGWIENWVMYRRLPEAIRDHRIGKVVGRQKLAWIADFMTKHTADIGGNLMLGFLLGMGPILTTFFGLPFAVRHVTLATGALAFAACSLGPDHIAVSAIVSIVLIGILNFGVSFALALAVAFRARDVSNAERVGLVISVVRAFVRHPWRFFFPPKDGWRPSSPSLPVPPSS